MDDRIIDKALTTDESTAAQVLAETLMDDKISTYKMYERLAIAYLSGSDEFRLGLSKAVEIIMDETLCSLAKRIVSAEEDSMVQEKESIQEEIDRIFDRIPA